MKVSQGVLALAVALAAAPAAAAAPGGRFAAAPMLRHGPADRPTVWRGHKGGGESRVAWRGHDSDGDGGGDRRGHHHRGMFGPAWAILEPSPEATSAGAPPLLVAAPLTVSVTITTAASTSTPQRWSPSGPRLIKLIGDPPHRRYPLVVYGD